MWFACLIGSAACLVLAVLIWLMINRSRLKEKHSLKLIHALFAGVACAAMVMFWPVHWTGGELGGWRALLLSVFNAVQVMAAGCEFGVVEPGLVFCPEWLNPAYQVWIAFLFALGPILTFGFVLSFFHNIWASLLYYRAWFRDAYIFSELNVRSLTLARDIRKHHKKAAIVFADVFEENEETSYELLEGAHRIGAVTFKKDILTAPFRHHAKKKPISFFTIGENETENLNQSIRLIEQYRKRGGTHLYVFSKKIESELLLTATDKGGVKVRRINEVQSLVNRTLYEEGHLLFEGARENEDGEKTISAVVVGMGALGTEMVKALAWYGQMDGYRLKIHAFDKDRLAKDRFAARAPELISPVYNGVEIPGEARYTIRIHSHMDATTASFAEAVSQITDATFVFVALGDDDANIEAAISLRMQFERMGIHPVIQAAVYHSEHREALARIRNYRGQPYDVTFVGDVESSYTEAVILDSELEEEALERHLKWGKEEEFWSYEYNYRSSVASAIHLRARIACGIPGADKPESEMTPAEREGIERLEHRRWNAYMRAEGYVFSGSKDKASRNDLAKMHHDLVDYAALSEEEKRKDSRVGSIAERLAEAEELPRKKIGSIKKKKASAWELPAEKRVEIPVRGEEVLPGAETQEAGTAEMEKELPWYSGKIEMGGIGGNEQSKSFSDASREIFLRSAVPESDGEAVLLRRKSGEKYPVAASGVIVGKALDADIVIAGNAAISRRHAEIVKKDSRCYYISDLNSVNHTWVNGDIVGPGGEHPLETGDIIRLADEEFEFICE